MYLCSVLDGHCVFLTPLMMQHLVHHFLPIFVKAKKIIKRNVLKDLIITCINDTVAFLLFDF